LFVLHQESISAYVKYKTSLGSQMLTKKKSWLWTSRDHTRLYE